MMEPYQCHFGEFTFSNYCDLVMHLRTHNGDKCSQCHIAFTQNSYLESHIRTTHTRESLYKCSHYENSFQVKTVLPGFSLFTLPALVL